MGPPIEKYLKSQEYFCIFRYPEISNSREIFISSFLLFLIGRLSEKYYPNFIFFLATNTGWTKIFHCNKGQILTLFLATRYAQIQNFRILGTR